MQTEELGREGIKELMEADVDTSNRFISSDFNPYEGNNDLSSVAPTKDEQISPDKEIDLERLAKVAQEMNVADKPEYKALVRSIKNTRKELLFKLQRKECAECSHEAPCCQSDCELFDLMEERLAEKWKEDRHRKLDPCKNCLSSNIACGGLRSKGDYESGKLPKVVIENIEEFISMNKRQQKAVLKEVGLKLANKEHKVSKPHKVKDIKLNKTEFDLETRFQLQKAGIDNITSKTDITALPQKTQNKIEQKFFAEIERVKKIYQSYKSEKIEYDEEREKAKQLAKNKKKFRQIVKENGWNGQLRVVKDKVQNLTEDYVINLVNTNGKVDNGATGLLLKITGTFSDYQKRVASVGKYHRKRIAGEVRFHKSRIYRGRNDYRVVSVFNVYLNKNDVDYDNVRKAISEIESFVNAQDKPKRVATCNFPVLDDRIKRILGVADFDTIIYNPFAE